MTSTETSATVQTTGGSLRGETREGIHSFKGIPYGAPTGGANRFMPPREPEPWSGTFDAVSYGPIAPQRSAGLRAGSTAIDDASGLEGEDCLVLNVFYAGPRRSQTPRHVLVPRRRIRERFRRRLIRRLEPRRGGETSSL